MKEITFENAKADMGKNLTSRRVLARRQLSLLRRPARVGPRQIRNLSVGARVALSNGTNSLQRMT
jgi:hypothetical protein